MFTSMQSHQHKSQPLSPSLATSHLPLARVAPAGVERVEQPANMSYIGGSCPPVSRQRFAVISQILKRKLLLSLLCYCISTLRTGGCRGVRRKLYVCFAMGLRRVPAIHQRRTKYISSVTSIQYNDAFVIFGRDILKTICIFTYLRLSLLTQYMT